jgi:thioredoxin 1
MSNRFRHLPAAAAVLIAAAGAQAQKPFAPLEAWESAVFSGDAAALDKLYSAGAVTQSGKVPISSQDERSYWASLKGRGITEFKPRLMEIMTLKGNGNIHIVLRLSVTSGAGHLYDIIRQDWAREGDGWKIVASQRGKDFGIEGTRTLPQPAQPNVNLYSEPGEAEAELKAGLAKAAKQHKRVILVFGGNWCYDCHVLDTTFRSKEFAPLVDANFVVIHINVGDDMKDNLDIAQRYGVVIDKGVPSLGILEANGTVVYSQKNGEFEDTVKFGPADVRAFLDKWKPRRG